MKKTKTISATEARSNFGEYLNEIRYLQTELVIERDGKKMARLVPLDNPEIIKTKTSGKFDFRKSAAIVKLPNIGPFTNTAENINNKELGAKK